MAAHYQNLYCKSVASSTRLGSNRSFAISNSISFLELGFVFFLWSSLILLLILPSIKKLYKQFIKTYIKKVKNKALVLIRLKIEALDRFPRPKTATYTLETCI